MHIPKLLLVAAVAVTFVGFAAPTVSFGMTCRQLCTDFAPKEGMTSKTGEGCQDLIDDAAGNCTTDDGRMNYGAHDLPRLGGYHPHSGRMVVLGNGSSGYRTLGNTATAQ